MSVTIKSEADLKRKIAELRSYVDESVTGAMAKGLRLQPGSWADKPRIGWHGAVCAVGAIGLRYAPVEDLDEGYRNAPNLYAGAHAGHIDFPGAVVIPLIRNGATDLIDELTLWALSDGFEGDTHLRPRGTSLLGKYRNAAYKLGRELRAKHCKED